MASGDARPAGEADQLARRVAVIDGGRIIAEGTPDELKSSVGNEHIEVTLAVGSEAPMTALKPYSKGSIQPNEAGCASRFPSSRPTG